MILQCSKSEFHPPLDLSTDWRLEITTTTCLYFVAQSYKFPQLLLYVAITENVSWQSIMVSYKN